MTADLLLIRDCFVQCGELNGAGAAVVTALQAALLA